MKKLLTGGLLYIGLAVFVNAVSAQDVAFSPNRVAPANPFPEKKTRIISEMDVDMHAVRDFRKNFANATDVQWVRTDNGTSVYFMNEGKRMRSSYNFKGNREYTLKYYDESGMSQNLRHRVKSNYYDHKIVIVTEVARNNQVYYLVKMENPKEYLTLRITDDDMSVFEKINKL
jgi:hypothetical protein